MSEASNDLELAVRSVEGLHPDDVVHWETKVAYLRALLAERTWRPIESAPRDGTQVLLYIPGEELLWTGFYDEFAASHGAGSPRGWIHDANHAEELPTHFMALPAPPEPKT